MIEELSSYFFPPQLMTQEENQSAQEHPENAAPNALPEISLQHAQVIQAEITNKTHKE